MNLAKTQLFSLGTKAVTTALGIVQSIIVIRLLGPANFGLAGLVMSVGSVVGVAQHLGIVDGAIREIAVLKDKAEIGKVFWVSHLVRQTVTVPLTIGLMLAAGFITDRIYGRPELTGYLLIFAASLVLQGLQDVLGATLTGLKRFGGLYAVQILTAACNIVIFGWLTWQWGLAGFFWAIILTTSLMVILLAGLVRRALGDSLRLPSRADLARYARRVMRIGAYMYLARIFFVVWQRLPLLVLGATLSADQLGYLNMSQTFGSRLTIIAMALSEVNLAWMSSLFIHERSEFTRLVTKNMHRVLVLMTALTLVLLFFTPEILRYLIGAAFLPAHDIVLVVTAAFYLYALMDIGTSSVFVPADKPGLRAALYGAMSGTTLLLLIGLVTFRPEPLLAGVAVLTGAMISYAAMVGIAQRNFGVSLVPKRLAVLLLLLGGGVVWLMGEPALLWRTLVFVLLLVYVAHESQQSNLLPRGIVRAAGDEPSGLRIICFAGAPFDQTTWTNRQQIMSRVAKFYPVLYVEPRVWIIRYLWQHRTEWRQLVAFLKRIVWHERRTDKLFIKSQWNIIPGSRELEPIALINHLINRPNVLACARLLGFHAPAKLVIWIYDTEAAEYLSAFAGARVLYDCVDDHAAQAGVDRNPRRVEEEEQALLARADLVTVTSRRLLELKGSRNPHAQLVLNAGDVELYARPAGPAPAYLANLPRPIVGSVGALDAYKFDFDLLYETACSRPAWSFVFVGAPVIDQRAEGLGRLKQLSNVHIIGTMPRQKVPAYVAMYDVCLIPYRASRYNAASFPLKFWEFMASGKPIVVTGLPELEEYREFIGYAENTASFIMAIEQALRDGRAGSPRRQSLAAEHSWDKRVATLLKLLTERT